MSLKLDTTTIFPIVSSLNAKRLMNLYNFDNKVIRSRQVATESKDAVFSSFFNFDQIKIFAVNMDYFFAHNMMVLPG